MSLQLVLIDDSDRDWRIDDETRAIGRRGIEAAREVLRSAARREAQPSADDPHVRPSGSGTEQERTVGREMEKVFSASSDPVETRLENFPKYVRRQHLTRFLALYEITQESCATRVAAPTRRPPPTRMGWGPRDHKPGPQARA